MTDEALMPGITASTVQTARIRVHLIERGPQDGVPVILLHGNLATSRYWEETMLGLPAMYRLIAPDMRAYGDTEALPIDATRGVRDWSDDLKALVDALGIERFHLAGWSMGGVVAMQYAIDQPADLLSLTLVSPIPPYGMGATRDALGTPTSDDYAGSGGGRVNPELVGLVRDGDRGSDSRFSPRNLMNATFFKPPFHVPPEREEIFLSALLKTQVGDGFLPGDSVPSANWPGSAPGTMGIYNAVSPKYLNLTAFAHIEPKPPVLWIRGTHDLIVSDQSPFDVGYLGKSGVLPGWPGEEAYPPQPMVAQVRHVLDAYADNGGRYWERVLENCGHSPHIERPEEFQVAFLKHMLLAV